MVQIKTKILIASSLLVLTILVAFTLPKPHYHSAFSFKKLHIPESFPGWQSEDIAPKLAAKEQDDRYKFISEIFARSYGIQNGPTLLFLVLDAGNFHHPQVCFKSSGFAIRELDDIEFQLAHKTLQAQCLFARKNQQQFLVIYWITINGRSVNWTQQKWQELLFSLSNQNRVGLMMRMDIPVAEDRIPEAQAFARKFVTDLEKEIPLEEIPYLWGR